MAADAEELERELSRGALDEMPDNRPPGILGEAGLDIRKTDSYRYENDAGLVQESSGEVRALVIALLTMVVVGAPVALWLLWRDKKLNLARKVVASALIAGYLVGLGVLVRK